MYRKRRVPCTIEMIDQEDEMGHPVESVQATCSRCGHKTESYGIGSGSIKRCLWLLSQECPNDESNFYFDEDEGEP